MRVQSIADFVVERDRKRRKWFGRIRVGAVFVFLLISAGTWAVAIAAAWKWFGS